MSLITKLTLLMPRRKSHAFEFKYEGGFQSLDALTVLHTQLNFVTILTEIKDYVSPEVKFDIKIKGVEKGSIEINHLIMVTAVAGMFIQDNYKYVETVIKIFSDLVKLKKFLRGEKAQTAKEVGNDKIEIHLHGDNITVDKNAITIYQNSPVITNAFNNTAKLLESNEDIDYIQLTEKSSQKKLLRLNKKEFPLLAEENPYLSRQTDEQVITNQVLFIKKPNLFPIKNKNWVWELIHRGRDIKAKIIDGTFRDKINAGFKVGQGDRLRADLKIYYKFNEQFNTFMESGKYDVVNITDIIERTSDSRFDF